MTQRSRAKEELSRFAVEEPRRGEERLNSIFEESPIGIALYDTEGRLIEANKSCLAIFNLSDARALGKLDFFVDLSRSDDVREKLRRGEMVRYQAAFDLEKTRKLNRHKQARSGIIFVDVLITPLGLKGGRALEGYLVHVQDVTEHKRTEEALRQARDELERQVQERTAELARANAQLQIEIAQRTRIEEERTRLLKDVEQLAETAHRRADELEAALAGMADGVFICDKEGRVVDVNEAGLRLFGLKQEAEALRPAVDHLRLLHLRHPDGRPIAVEELVLTRALRGEVVRGYEEIARDVRTGRDIYLLVSAAPIRDRQGHAIGAVQVLSDISRIKELDKIEDEFIAVAAHELKTPVAIMKGYAQTLLRAKEALTPKQRRALEAINRGSDRIDRIVVDLLDIVRFHAGGMELARAPCDLPELVADAIAHIARTTQRHHLQLVGSEPAVVLGDRARLEQALVELLENAIKYSSRGGDIDIALGVRNRAAIVSVRDYGVGIPQQKQGNIFQPFYSAHTGTPHNFGGLAVGLYIAREIIKRHGGRMWFESEEGQGSTFYFSLPLAPSTP